MASRLEAAKCQMPPELSKVISGHSDGTGQLGLKLCWRHWATGDHSDGAQSGQLRPLAQPVVLQCWPVPICRHNIHPVCRQRAAGSQQKVLVWRWKSQPTSAATLPVLPLDDLMGLTEKPAQAQQRQDPRKVRVANRASSGQIGIGAI